MVQKRPAWTPLSAMQILCCAAMVAILPVAASAQERTRSSENTFTRMFPGLNPFAPATDEMREQAKRLGTLGGPIDAMDLLTDPIQSILNPAVHSPNNPDNPTMTAGVTFLGQFIDHYLTLDPRSPLMERTDPRRTTNFRTAAFDLDSVYGNG
ncbi:MAG: hypothetical protein HOP35_11530, partial [Nitrospira sp.]|nr:hypothetical protein [Nitrospira sp.]